MWLCVCGKPGASHNIAKPHIHIEQPWARPTQSKTNQRSQLVHGTQFVSSWFRKVLDTNQNVADPPCEAASTSLPWRLLCRNCVPHVHDQPLRCHCEEVVELPGCANHCYRCVDVFRDAMDEVSRRCFRRTVYDDFQFDEIRLATRRVDHRLDLCKRQLSVD
jgi:hypothetical protein